ncbi:MAG TPA: collagen-like protein [Solirubrobacteraceae bacterium]|nr:collagen-like protein [Solirubrobacteraceae bacterium]
MSSSIRRHLTYANVTATLVLVFAMSGGALAAKHYTKPKHYTKHYIINSTGQINPKVIKKLRGRVGPPGLSGKEGPPGRSGPAGVPGAGEPSGPGGGITAFNSNSDSELDFPAVKNEPETVASLSLPAGNFSVVGKLIADNQNSSTQPYMVRCELFVGKTVIDPGYGGVALGEGGKDVSGKHIPPQAERHYLVLAGTGSLSSPGTAEIVCKVGTPSGKYMDRSITATQVGSLG